MAKTQELVPETGTGKLINNVYYVILAGCECSVLSYPQLTMYNASTTSSQCTNILETRPHQGRTP